jgi:hypothetical protein
MQERTMSTFSNYLENAVLNHVFRNTALTSPGTVHMALYTAAPTDSGGGTQVTGAGYARQTVTFGAPSNGVIANTAEVEFTATGGNFGAVVAVGYFDASTAGNLLAWDPIVSATINDGDTLRFPAGELTIALD